MEDLKADKSTIEGRLDQAQSMIVMIKKAEED
jgi:hypothetical protein